MVDARDNKAEPRTGHVSQDITGRNVFSNERDHSPKNLTEINYANDNNQVTVELMGSQEMDLHPKNALNN